MKHSNSSARLKTPPATREACEMSLTKDGNPAVIRRRFGYWQTNLERLSVAEKELAEYRAQHNRLDRDPTYLSELQARVENRKAWLQFSEDTLRNSVHFAWEAVRCAKAAADKSSDQGAPVDAGAGGAPEVDKETYDNLRYFNGVLEQFLIAKKAVAQCSLSEQAVKQLVEMNGKTLTHFAAKSLRERDDADQASLLGLLEAARKFDPNPEVSRRAMFTTFASLWIRRRAQARRTSHCRPGTMIAKGKFYQTGTLDCTDDQSRPDQFHPGGLKPKLALKLDVADALAALDPQSRNLVVDHMIYKVPIAELGRQTGLSVAKVRVVLAAAKSRLSSRLAAFKG